MRSIVTLTLCLALSLPVVSSCSKTQDERCRTVCQRETDCAERRSELEDDNVPYDLDECVAACVALERDSAGKRLVEKHVECAQLAGESCEALMECR
jgi:hypothetical protein